MLLSIIDALLGIQVPESADPTSQIQRDFGLRQRRSYNEFREALSEQRGRIYLVVTALASIRKLDQTYWAIENGRRSRTIAALEDLRQLARNYRPHHIDGAIIEAPAGDSGALEEWADEAYRCWPKISNDLPDLGRDWQQLSSDWPSLTADWQQLGDDYPDTATDRRRMNEYDEAVDAYRETVGLSLGGLAPEQSAEPAGPSQREMLHALRLLGQRLGSILEALEKVPNLLLKGGGVTTPLLAQDQRAAIDSTGMQRHGHTGPIRNDPATEATTLLTQLVHVPEADQSNENQEATSTTRVRSRPSEIENQQSCWAGWGTNRSAAEIEKADAYLKNLLALHVIDTMTYGARTSNEQTLELMQVSWDSDDVLTNRRPEEKLAGPELGRLGAFVKPSWRSNDWFWGRMDGANRVAMLLLDPRRLLQLRKEPQDVVASIEDALAKAHGADADSIRQSAYWAKLTTDMTTELDFLHPTSTERPPATLPHCVRAFTYVLQLAITEDELPKLYDSLQHSIEKGAVEGDDGNFRRSYEGLATQRGQFTPQETTGLLQKMRIGQETASGEIRGDLLLRTITQGAAVGIKALSGTAAGANAITRVFRPLRIPASAAHGFVSNATHRSRAAQAITLLSLVVSGAFIGLAQADVGLAKGVGVVALIVFVISLITSLLRANLWSSVPAVVLLGLAGFTLVGDNVDDFAYKCSPAPGSTTCDQWKTVGFVRGWSAGFWLLFLLFAVGFVTLGRDWIRYRRARPQRVDPAWIEGGFDPPTSDDALAQLDKTMRRLTWRTALFFTAASVSLANFTWVSQWVLEGRRVNDGEDTTIRSALVATADWLHDQRNWVVLVLFIVVGWVLSFAWDRGRTRFFDAAASKVRTYGRQFQ